MKMKNIFYKNKKLNKKNLVIFGSSVILLGGAISLVSCNAGNQKDNTPSQSYDDDNSKGNDIKTSASSNIDNTNSVIEPVEEKNDETIEIVLDEDEKDELIEFEPNVVYMTLEDVVKLSESYAEYLNKVGVFQTENYAYNKFEAKDLYSAIYLSNIDCFTKEETSKLIENGIINDDIPSIIVDSFEFFNFYQTDTINKVRNNDTNLIDLSLMFANDEKAIEVSNTMNKVFAEINSDDMDKISNNFIDTYAYFAMGVELPVQNYDYSKSVYTSDRSQLSVGSEYALSYAAEVIKDLSIEKGVTTREIGSTLSEIINDRSNIVRVFNDCVETKEESKTLVK